MYRITRIRRRTAIVLDDFHKEIQKRMRSTEDGFAMAMVVFIVMIISLLGLSMLTVAAYQMRDSDRTLPSNRAFDLADAGLSYAHGYLAQDNVIPDPTASDFDRASDRAHMGQLFEGDSNRRAAHSMPINNSRGDIIAGFLEKVPPAKANLEEVRAARKR